MAKTDAPETERQQNKLALIGITNELMPGGQPAFLDVIKYPKITDLVKQKGDPVILLILSVMVRDFCSCFNVSRNMNEDQILEAAAMLLNECGNFRLEDYTMMFAMAKKGQLVKIYDRIDITVITEILDKYWEKRRDAAEIAQEKEARILETLGPTGRHIDGMNQQDVKLLNMANGIAGALSHMKSQLKNKLER